MAAEKQHVADREACKEAGVEVVAREDGAEGVYTWFSSISRWDRFALKEKRDRAWYRKEEKGMLSTDDEETDFHDQAQMMVYQRSSISGV